jgi:hypothetical protein
MTVKRLLIFVLFNGFLAGLNAQGFPSNSALLIPLGHQVPESDIDVSGPALISTEYKRTTKALSNGSSHQFPRLDLGLTTHYLAASEHYESGFSGIGLSLACHLNRHVALLFQRQYWQQVALDPDSYETPLIRTQWIINQRLLRLSFGLLGQTFFLHSGLAFPERQNHGTEGTFIYGMGYCLPLPYRLFLTATLDHRGFNDEFDEHLQLNLEIAYPISERGGQAPHLLGKTKKPAAFMKPPWLDIGLNSNLLLKSDRFRYGYSGMGFSLNLYVYKNFAIVYRHQFRSVTSKDTTNYYTPFRYLRTPVQVYLLRFPVYFNSDAFFLQFGTVYHRKPRQDRDGEAGFVGGIGYRLPLTDRLSLSVYMENYALGSISVGGGHSYDAYRELSLELTASIPYPVP